MREVNWVKAHFDNEKTKTAAASGGYVPLPVA